MKNVEGHQKKFEDGDQKGAVYHELLKPGETVNTNRYRQQMINLNQAFIEKRPEWARRHGKVILLHDNAPAHKAKLVQYTIKALGWELLPTRYIHQTWPLPTTICFHRWDTHWLSSTSIPTKKSKIGCLIGLLQKTNISIGVVSTNCQKGRQNV